MSTDYEPVHVHVANLHEMATPPAPRRRRRALSTRSFTLTAADPVQEILPQADGRAEAWVIFTANDITIATSKADAQAGGGAVATLTHLDAVPFPVNTTDAVYATAAAATLPVTVSVVAIYEQED